MSSPDRVRAVMDILIQKKKGGENFTVVFSAFGGVTDSLIEMSEKASIQDDRYLELLEQFKSRHLTASNELIGSEVSAELELNHKDLAGLFTGYIFNQGSV